MFCSNCGTKLEENTAFCPSCGTAVKSDSSAQPDQAASPNPTVLPTPEQGRIDPRSLTPEPQQEQEEIDISSMIEDLSAPESEPEDSKQGFTDEDMAWFTDMQPKSPPQPQPQNPPQPVPPQQTPQQPPFPAPDQAAPQYFSQIPAPVDLTPVKSNVLLGVIGAVVFSLIGCVIWVIIGSFGYVSYLGALALSFLTVTGYKLLGRKFDASGVIACLLVVAAAVFASNLFIHAIDLSQGLDEMKEEIMAEAVGYDVTEAEVDEVLDTMGLNPKGFMDVFLHFFDYADAVDEYASDYASSGVKGIFLLNLGLGYLFAGIAFAVVAVSQYRASKYS